VGLSGFSRRQVQQLSGGEQQRVHLARVLSQLSAHRLPQFLFLDEPTSSLDVRHQVDVLRLVRARVSEQLGVIVVLHDLNLAAAFAGRLLIMQDGRTVADGPPGDVLSSELLSSVYGIGMTNMERDGRRLFFPDLGLTG
jgi:iron complex transport system ATP-binding protein